MKKVLGIIFAVFGMCSTCIAVVFLHVPGGKYQTGPYNDLRFFPDEIQNDTVVKKKIGST